MGRGPSWNYAGPQESGTRARRTLSPSWLKSIPSKGWNRELERRIGNSSIRNCYNILTTNMFSLSITGGRNKYDPLSKYRPPPGMGGTPIDTPKAKPDSSDTLKATADNTGVDPDGVDEDDDEDSDNEIDNESVLNNQVRELKDKLKTANDKYSVLVSQNKGKHQSADSGQEIVSLKARNEHLDKLNKAASIELRKLKDENAKWEKKAANPSGNETILKALEEGRKATTTVARRLTRLIERLDEAGLLGHAPSQPDPNVDDQSNPNPLLDPDSERGVTDPGRGTGV
jgi:hypothetical protein